jgi:centromere/kinetochore protein ZW10
MLLALESLSPLLGSASGEGDGPDVTQSRDAAEKLVPSWRKLARLTDLLDMSLRPITQSWESGDLTSCGFSSDEVQKLIKAIFSDTPLRTECLARISSH